ncbi:T9SS type A sorting domain-containing protein [Aquimarina agarilytica]|uniref:T9SS type A sorting domain-containing protein n=1 Tax=Aquimarina agarilytica TaxID=1087449 RepID=UPI00028906A8|nr:T9SS type A sorting domain-containing protein [Aquimarina agarilytica]
MKKITFLFAVFAGLVAFAQQSISIASINGQSYGDFATATSTTLQVGTDYVFVIDYTDQEVVDNDIQVKIIVDDASFADTENIVIQPITTASGQVTLTLTPTEVVPAATIQIRLKQTTNFGTETPENLFFFGWEVEAAPLSVNDFSKDNISAAISQKDGIVTIANSVETEDYKLYDMSGALVIEKEADGILDINGLPNGVYILSTDAGLTKIGK